MVTGRDPVPPDASAWDNCVHQFQHDLKEMIKLVKNHGSTCFAKIPHGDGQTILREALILRITTPTTWGNW